MNHDAKYDALTIAKWFVAWAEANDAGVSNLKLQKLLYYAQGHHLGDGARPLFKDDVQAWSHGPVVETVYHAFKSFGSDDLTLGEDDQFDWPMVDKKTTQFLIGIWDAYGGIAAWKLRNMTHDESPWKDHFDADERNIVIPRRDLETHFRRCPVRA